MSNKYPQVNINAFTDNYMALEHILDAYMYNNLHTVIPVEVVKVSQGLVDVKPLIKSRDILGETIDDLLTLSNIPIMQMVGSQFEISVKLSVGDKGLLFACMNDISDYKSKHGESVVTTNRHYNFADGVFLPLDFTSEKTDITIKNGTTILTLSDNEVIVNSSIVTVNADTVNIGNGELKAVARVGDSVDLSTGLITTGSSVVKAG